MCNFADILTEHMYGIDIKEDEENEWLKQDSPENFCDLLHGLLCELMKY